MFVCFAAGYLARLPLDLSRLSAAWFGREMPIETRTQLTWLMFPVAVGLIAYATVRWLWFACPRCSHPFMGAGPKVFGRELLVNPMAESCGHCGLRKWSCADLATGGAEDAGMTGFRAAEGDLWNAVE